MEMIVSEILSILIDIGKGSFNHFWGRIKLFRIEKRLKKKLSREILDKYGNKLYYNELDKFLSTNKVIQNLIINCKSSSIYQYKSRCK